MSASRDTIFWPRILFLIPHSGIGLTCACCVYADDVLVSTETACSWGALGGVWLSVRYSQFDEQQFSRGEHSKLKPLVPGRYICWLFKPKLKSEVHLFYFYREAMLQCCLQNAVSFTQPCSSESHADFLLEGDTLVLLGLLLVSLHRFVLY